MDFKLNLASESVTRAHPAVPICVQPDASLSDVMSTLKSDNRGAVLVCQDDVLVGIFTERDAVKLMASGADWNVPIEQVMVRNPVCLKNTDTVADAIESMSNGGYRRLPIVDDSNRPIGILKVSGILHFLVEHFPNVIYNLPPEPHHTMQTREGA